MDALERYKRLSTTDKYYLTRYSIYNSIYDVATNENIELDDETVKKIESFSYNLYLETEPMNSSESEIGFFVTKCYINDNAFFDKVKDMKCTDILKAVNSYNYTFYMNNEMER